MLTDLIFDFFGTLVGYTADHFNGGDHRRSHAMLVERGFALGYEEFIAGFTGIGDEHEAAARATFREYHMHDVAGAFLRGRLGGASAAGLVEEFAALYIDEWNGGTVFWPELPPRMKLS